MSKFIYIYSGPATPMDQFTPEQAAKEDAAWRGWMGALGAALVEGGAPFMGASVSVRDDGSKGPASQLSGYTVIEAADLAAAEALTEGHPFLSEGKGRFSIEVFELGRM